MKNNELKLPFPLIYATQFYWIASISTVLFGAFVFWTINKDKIDGGDGFSAAELYWILMIVAFVPVALIYLMFYKFYQGYKQRKPSVLWLSFFAVITCSCALISILTYITKYNGSMNTYIWIVSVILICINILSIATIYNRHYFKNSIVS